VPRCPGVGGRETAPRLSAGSVSVHHDAHSGVATTKAGRSTVHREVSGALEILLTRLNGVTYRKATATASKCVLFGYLKVRLRLYGAATAYELEGRGSIPGKNFLCSVQTTFGVRLAFYPMNTVSGVGVKWSGRAGGHSPHLVPRTVIVELYIHALIFPYDIFLLK
jgi:hypothetical protein